MKSVLITIIVFIFVIYFAQMAFALQIISPKEGQVVYQGDRLTVIVKPDAGENWKEVLLEIAPMTYNIIFNEYREEIEIPRDETTGIIDFEVLAYDNSGNKVKLTRNLFVKLPPNVALNGIEVDNYEVIYKLASGSTVQNIQDIETTKLNVKGVYSDSVKRKMTASAMGTSYSSSDEKVVTVSPEGKVAAQGLGTATITVRNGKFRANVKVVVKPYKK
ncbi:MAG: hypothetical protein HZB33_07385 [Nitrospirae bacterium]|nr:hypothetical protein [Nitrospirota bacterium]